MADIYGALVKVMQSLGGIEKGQENKFDRYKFRGIDDVYNALQPVLVEHGVVVIPSVEDAERDTYTTTKEAVMQRAAVDVTYTFYAASDGSSVQARVMGEGADRGDKAVNKALSSAFKTAMFQTLCIPTHEQSDSEHDSPDGQKPQRNAPAKKAAAKKKAARKADPSRKDDAGIVTEDDRADIHAAAEQRHAAFGDESPGVAGLVTECFHSICEGAYKEAGLAQLREVLLRAHVDELLTAIGKWEPSDAPGFVEGAA